MLARAHALSVLQVRRYPYSHAPVVELRRLEALVVQVGVDAAERAEQHVPARAPRHGDGHTRRAVTLS
eukprot:6205811-Pleurochrysis_carterae.AAC.1